MNHIIQEKLAKYLENNSIKDEDRIIFAEQDAYTLAMNIIKFLKNEKQKSKTEKKTETYK